LNVLENLRVVTSAKPICSFTPTSLLFLLGF
jgi:hypothetical protein